MSESKENFLKSAVLVAEDSWGLTISLEKLTEIIGDTMKDEWTLFKYEDVSYFMDTAPREEIADLISLHYLGREWPKYGENVDIQAFVKSINNKIKEEAKQ